MGFIRFLQALCIDSYDGGDLERRILEDDLARLESLDYTARVIANDFRLAARTVQFDQEHPPVTIETRAMPQNAEVVDPANPAT